MNSSDQTLWQAMSPMSRDQMVAKPSVPAFFALLYGVYKVFDLGTSGDHYLYTYLPLTGGIASIASIMIYSAVCVSGKGTTLAMLGFIPYVFSLYLIGFLGVYGVWQSIDPFSVWRFIAGVIWVMLGYRLLRKFWIITELCSMSASQENIAEILISKLGMKPRELKELLLDEQTKQLVLNER